ncbi:hypothetical protein SUGI_0129440 [Cryptomeria japonica]|nr:hypothetical protein SUGI_0129440 [Cryptomeria japonica]
MRENRQDDRHFILLSALTTKEDISQKSLIISCSGKHAVGFMGMGGSGKKVGLCIYEGLSVHCCWSIFLRKIIIALRAVSGIWKLGSRLMNMARVAVQANLYIKEGMLMVGKIGLYRHFPDFTLFYAILFLSKRRTLIVHIY